MLDRGRRPSSAWPGPRAGRAAAPARRACCWSTPSSGRRAPWPRRCNRLADIAPSLRVLTTGRHPSALPGERVWPVAPLDVPPADDRDRPRRGRRATRRSRCSSTGCARSAASRWTRGEVGALVDLVRRLGGLPLAIELAAARGRVLDLNEILDRYGDRVLDLAGPQSRGASPPGGDGQPARRGRRQLPACWSRTSSSRCAGCRCSATAGRSSWPRRCSPTTAAAPSRRPGPAARPARRARPGQRARRRAGSGSGCSTWCATTPTERAAADGELAAIRRRHAEVIARLAGRIAPDLAGANLHRARSRGWTT